MERMHAPWCTCLVDDKTGVEDNQDHRVAVSSTGPSMHLFRDLYTEVESARQGAGLLGPWTVRITTLVETPVVAEQAQAVVRAGGGLV